MKQLTLEQQKIVEENHNLIYDFAKKRNVMIEEYYDILAIGLCKAAIGYDSNISKFSTYAYQCMSNELNMYWEHIMSQKKIPENMIVSYDIPLSGEDSNETYLNNIVDDFDLANNVLSNIGCNYLLGLLTDREKIVALSIFNGITQKNIAKMLKCSQQNVSNRIVKNIKKKWIPYLQYN